MEQLPEESSRYGMISVHISNVGPKGIHLVDSELEHNRYISLAIHSAYYKRSMNSDKYFQGDKIIEISLTMQQWAEFIASVGTTGVPCTLEFTEKEGQLFRKEEVPHINKIKLHQDEYQTHWKNNIKEMRELVTKLSEGIDNKAGKKEMREILQSLDSKIRNFIPNEKFALDQFNEHIEQRLTQAKIELAGYLERQGISLNENGNKLLGIQNVYAIEDSKEANVQDN